MKIKVLLKGIEIMIIVFSEKRFKNRILATGRHSCYQKQVSAHYEHLLSISECIFNAIGNFYYKLSLSLLEWASET